MKEKVTKSLIKLSKAVTFAAIPMFTGLGILFSYYKISDFSVEVSLLASYLGAGAAGIVIAGLWYKSQGDE